MTSALKPSATALRWTVVLPAIGFALVVAGAVVLVQAGPAWTTWRPATCMPDHCFCEAIRTGVVRQPSNTWSSFGFVLVAFVLVGMSKVDRRAAGAASVNPMLRSMLYPVLFCSAVFMVGIGSAFYHASLSFVGQFADVFGMYLIGTFILIYNLGRLRAIGAKGTVFLYLTLNTVLCVLLYQVPVLRRYLFALVIVAALALEYRSRRDGRRISDGRYLLAAIGSLLVAFGIWIVDITKIACDPYSIVQGHALWHVLGAGACGCVFLYYRSESGLALHSTDSRG